MSPMCSSSAGLRHVRSRVETGCLRRVSIAAAIVAPPRKGDLRPQCLRVVASNAFGGRSGLLATSGLPQRFTAAFFASCVFEMKPRNPLKQ